MYDDFRWRLGWTSTHTPYYYLSCSNSLSKQWKRHIPVDSPCYFHLLSHRMPRDHRLKLIWTYESCGALPQDFCTGPSCLIKTQWSFCCKNNSFVAFWFEASASRVMRIRVLITAGVLQTERGAMTWPADHTISTHQLHFTHRVHCSCVCVCV